MGELTSFVLFSERTEDVSRRRLAIESLMATLPIWFKQPFEVMRLNYETGEQEIESWEGSKLLEAPLEGPRLLFVYIKTEDDTARPNSMGITREQNITVYTYDIEQTQLLMQPVTYIEQCLVDLVRTATSLLGCSVMFAGSEEAWNHDHTTTSDVIRYALLKSSNLYWVMAERQRIASPPEWFEVVCVTETHCLLRRRDMLLASGFHF